MKLRFATLLLAGLAAVCTTWAQPGPSLLENLGRGLVALRTSPTTVVVTWRVLGTDPADVAFNLYRSVDGGAPVLLNTEPITGATHVTDAAAPAAQAHTYLVRPIIFGVEQTPGTSFTVGAGAPVRDYLRVPLQVPPPGVTTVGEAYTYSPNDVSAGDLDGDGEYELVVKWEPSNAKDNSQAGHTGNTLLDGYKLDGTRLWRIDLGVNIRAGAHYTQFMVYDLDGDGIAEVACRTAPGSRDGLGNYVAAPAKFVGVRPETDHTADLRNSSGYILTGPEFLTIFHGQTGAELASTNYNPPRHPDTLYPTPDQINAIWGDNYGNRIDRFNAAVAYFDGQRPSLVMARGYYTRAVVVAYDFRDGQLTERWVFDTNPNGGPAGPYGAWRGQGNHQVSVADLDGDGRDEIVFGAATIDHDGRGLYSTGLGHGDALHVSKMDPDRPGVQIFQPHESPTSYGANALSYIDGATGQLIWGVQATGDIGRGVAFDVDPRYRGYEMWGSGGTGGMYTAQLATPNAVLGPRAVEIASGKPSINFGLWWDGDLLRELLDGVTVSKWNWETSTVSTLLSPAGVASNNGTKATPALSADLLGDWREEVIWRETSNDALRIYVSPLPTAHRIYTLMHDRQYRLAIAWQNVSYNQPPHPSFFLGHGMAPAPTPNIVTSLNVLLGPTAPVFTGITDDTGSSNTDRITSDTTLLLHGTAQPNTTVNLIRLGVGPIGSVPAGPSGAWTFDYTGTVLPGGEVSFQATATNADGITGAPSMNFIVTIDVTAPAAPTITLISDNGSGLTIAGTAVAHSTVTVSRTGMGVIGSTTADEDGFWSLNYAVALPPGVHAFTATATDLAGNTSVASGAATVDTALASPVITGITEDTGTSASDGITADNQILIHGTASPGATIAVTRIGYGSAGTTTASEAGAWTLDLTATPLPEGDYLFAAAATAGGSTSASSAPFAVTIDTTAPIVEAVTRLSPTSASGNASAVTYQVAFSETVAGVDVSDFTLTVTGDLAGLIASVTPTGGGGYEVVVNLTGEGTLRLDVNDSGTGIVDAAGNALVGGFTTGSIYSRLLTGDGTWTRSTSGGNWSDNVNWVDGIVASGISTTADFSKLELTEDVIVNLDAPRTIGNVVFGDTDIGSGASWAVNDVANAGHALTLQVGSGTPTVSVLPMGVGASVQLNVPLAGTQGVTKLGPGLVALTRPNTLSGVLNVNGGSLRVEPTSSLSVGTVSVASGSRLLLAGAFSSGNLTVNAGGSSALIVEGGTANFGVLATNNSAGGLIRINGGTVTATGVNLPRSNDNSLAFGAGFVVAGGSATVNGSVGIGTNNSYGVMSVEGGDLLVNGNIRIGDLGSNSNRGGVMRVTAGSLTSTTAEGGGLIFSVRNANTSHGHFLGGVTTVEVMTLGGAGIASGAATVNINGGSVYLGSGGLVKGGAAGMTTTINLTSGILGAKANWSSTLPMVLMSGGNIHLHAANAADAPFDITLGGALTGAGGFTKTGGGTLALTAASTFSGPVVVSEGTLRLDGSLTNGGGIVTVAAGGALAGHGSSAKAVALEAGGTIVPDGTLSLASLEWSAGGSVALDLSSHDRLALTGALAKSGSGAYTFALDASAPLVPATVYTLATFGSTTFSALDFSHTGLPGQLGGFAVTPGSVQFAVVPTGPTAAFDLWAILEDLPAGQRGPGDDSEGDGLANLLEFALGLDPALVDEPALLPTTVDVAGARYPAVAYLRRADLGGASVAVEIASTPAFGDSYAPVQVSTTPQPEGMVLVVVRSSASLAAQPQQFFRLSATLPAASN